MSTAKLKRLQSAGRKTGSAKDLLKLGVEEAMLVELKLSLTDAIRQSRQKRGTLTTALVWRKGEASLMMKALQTELAQ